MEAKSRRGGVIKRERVRADDHERRPAAQAVESGRRGDAGSTGAARVRLLRLDENTQALELTCSCGEVSLIEIRTEKKP
jgi:hypothetical protein